jgi:hypothetical protein
VRHHRAHLGPRRVQPRHPSLALVERGWRLVLLDGILAELDQHEMPVGVVADADEPGPEQRLVLFDGTTVVHGVHVGRHVGILLLDAVEELLRLGREQRDLFLLDEDREQRGALARLDHEGARTRHAERARTDGVDGVEFDVIGHASPSFGSGRRSVRPPVSLHFTNVQPNGWNSNTVADAGETCRRWNRSRCMPV